MPTATPETLSDVLAAVVRSAADEAAKAPDALAGILQQALAQAGQGVQELKQLPADAMDKLKRLVDPPDWFSLLAFVLVKLAELVPNLTVGVTTAPELDPAGPAPGPQALSLTYANPALAGATFKVALAITDHPGHHGLVISIDDNFDQSLAGGPLSLRVQATGGGKWAIPFAGSISRQPDAAGTLTLTLNIDLPAGPAAGDVVGVSLGPVQAGASLTYAPGSPLAWNVSAGIGAPPGKPGLGINLTPSRLLGKLGDIVHIADVHQGYSPLLTLAPGSSPAFDLRHTGS